MIVPKKDCTGCTACMSACPIQCIEMCLDAEGFCYPVIDRNLCIGCRQCEVVCPVANREEGLAEPVAAYGAKIKEQSELYKSSSGGVFYALACEWLRQGAEIWGAAYDKELNIVHQKATTIEELQGLRKSKYVQSDLKQAFREIADTLKHGGKVLFSGTPCQVAGLAHYLGGLKENLLLVQVFCAHIIGPGIWKKYVAQIEQIYQDKLVSFDFRYKQPIETKTDAVEKGKAAAGWKYSCYRMEFNDGKTMVLPWEKSTLAGAFLDALILRPSCTECKFKLGRQTFADLSIGDFWGCENTQPECFDPHGVSAIITYTPKGKHEIEQLRELDLYNVEVINILSGNPGAVNPAKAHPNREAFFADLPRNDMDILALIRKHNGFLAARASKVHRFGLFGSYNTRMAIISMCAGSDSTLAYQYSNSSLISLFAPAIDLPEGTVMPQNPFRRQMLLADMHKDFISGDVDQSVVNVDYLIVDFVEERFDLLAWQGSILTFSDALQDSSFAEGIHVSRFSQETEQRWQQSCQQFIRFLEQHFSPEQIILVRAPLSQSYIDNNGNRVSFENADELRNLNELLAQYYDYFETHYPIINRVTIQDPALLYCEKGHKHGILPCHMNTEYVRALAGLLTDKVCG